MKPHKICILKKKNTHCKTLVKLKIIQTNGKIFCAHGLEKAVLLKYLYYAKQSKSNPNQNSNSTVHRNRTNNSKICMKP